MALISNSLPPAPRAFRRGFTSIEFLAAVVIGAIVSVMAIGSYRFYQHDLPVKHVARRLSHALSAARALAVAQEATYTVMIDRRYKSFWVDQTDTTGTIQIPKVISPEPIDDKVDLIGIQFGVTPVPAGASDPVAIRFFADGSSEDARVFLRMVNAAAVPSATFTVRNYGPTGESKVFENQQLMTTTGP